MRQTPSQNPVRRVYELYLGDRLTRSSWDQVAVLYAGTGLTTGPHPLTHLRPALARQGSDLPSTKGVL